MKIIHGKKVYVLPKKVRLGLYKKALEVWLLDEDWQTGTYTMGGFCCYFEDLKYKNENIWLYGDYFEFLLPELFQQRTITDDNSWWLFNGSGETKLGRKERITALKAAIKLCESKLKTTAT